MSPPESSPTKVEPSATERERTDESLRVEREKVDEVLADEPTAIEDAADTVIHTARLRADETIAANRARLDQEPPARGPDAVSAEALEKERAVEDRVLRKERAVVDEARRTERAEGAALLESEREKTDENLSRERIRSDEALAARDEFLGIVSHDLRNLLGSVVGFSALIVRAESGETEHRTEQVLKHARRIQRVAVRMNRLIGDLLDVVSIEAGALAVTRQPADPTQVVMEAVETFQAQARAGGVSLVADTVGAPGLADFDPARVLQVLANLLGNALKFTPSGGKVIVRVDQTDDGLRFAVRDTGVGIAADQLATVFERFRQARRGDRRGVGLGLYISKSIVQGHGGRIGVESRPSEGAAFWFTLPAHVPA